MHTTPANRPVTNAAKIKNQNIVLSSRGLLGIAVKAFTALAAQVDDVALAIKSTTASVLVMNCVSP